MKDCDTVSLALLPVCAPIPTPPSGGFSGAEKRGVAASIQRHRGFEATPFQEAQAAENLGHETQLFCYPSSHGDPEVKALAKR